MIFIGFVVGMIVLNAYLWVLHKKVRALPKNTRHKHRWLKDEPIPLEDEVRIVKEPKFT